MIMPAFDPLTFAAQAGETAKPSDAPSCAAPADLTRLDTPAHPHRAAHSPPGAADHRRHRLIVYRRRRREHARAFLSEPARGRASAAFPDQDITVLNRGTNGEDAREMLARFEQSVMAENPDLVLWQVGTNSLLFDRPLENAGSLMLEGIDRLKAIGVDVVLIDPQFAPKVLAKPADRQIDGRAVRHREARQCQHLPALRGDASLAREVAGLPFHAFLSPDELHMNDWSYACVGKLLAASIAEAATRPSTVAHSPSGGSSH